MSPFWGDLTARAAGLETHLLTGADLHALALEPDLPALGAALAARGWTIPADATTSVPALELALRRESARRMHTLERWAGDRRAALALVFDGEDCRSLRALVRGAAQHADAAARLVSLIPTPALPERALEELARQATPRLVAATLAAWGSPYAAPLLAEAASQEPDLLRLDAAVTRTWARRALDGASRADRHGPLLAHVRDLIDIENAYTGLALAGGAEAGAADVLFIPGGARLSRAVFDSAIALGPALAADRLADSMERGPLSAALRTAATNPEGMERVVLSALIVNLHRVARLDPVGPAPLLSYALALRAEAIDLRRIVWGLSLGAPAALRA